MFVYFYFHNYVCMYEWIHWYTKVRASCFGVLHSLVWVRFLSCTLVNSLPQCASLCWNQESEQVLQWLLSPFSLILPLGSLLWSSLWEPGEVPGGKDLQKYGQLPMQNLRNFSVLQCLHATSSNMSNMLFKRSCQLMASVSFCSRYADSSCDYPNIPNLQI